MIEDTNVQNNGSGKFDDTMMMMGDCVWSVGMLVVYRALLKIIFLALGW